MDIRHDFVSVLLGRIGPRVYYKLLQLFDSFNIFSADNVMITELSFRDDDVFLTFGLV